MTLDDAPDGWSAAPKPLSPTSLLVAVATLALMATFIVALAGAQPQREAFLVVVSDPRMQAGKPVPVQVLGFAREGHVDVAVTVNGAHLDVAGFGTVIPDDLGLHIRGTVTARDGTTRPVALDAALLASSSPPAIEVTPWTQALAMPVAGAAVFPLDGKVRARERNRVVLVDGEHVDIVEVDTALDQRLPDQRLLAVDRSNVAIESVSAVSGAVDVVVRARDAASGVVSITVGDRLVAMLPVVLAVGLTPVHVALTAPAATGDIVVAHIAESLLPSAPRAQLATRIGGWRDEDLLRVAPGARDALSNLDVRTALGRALHVVNAAPVIVSPTAAQQAAHHERVRAADAEAARRRYRVMALLHVAVIVYAAWQARARLALAVAAAVLVGSIDLGLDAIIDVTAATSATTVSTPVTSGSP
jgi:hypothetical protein